MDKDEDKDWVEIAVDAPKPDETKVDETPQEPVDSQEAQPQKERTAKRIKQLLRERAEERTAREALEAKTAELEKRLAEVANTQVQSVQTQYQTHRSALDSKEQAARDKKRKAFEAGNFDEMDLADEELQKARLEKMAFDAWQANQRKAQAVQQPAPQGPAPQEAPREAVKWAKRHAEWFGARGEDREATMVCMALADSLVKEGVDPQDAEFYTELEQRLVEKMPYTAKYFEEEEPSQKKVPPKSPVGGQSRTAAPNKNSVRLSREELDAAEKMGITPDRYARRKVEAETKRDASGWTNVDTGARE